MQAARAKAQPARPSSGHVKSPMKSSTPVLVHEGTTPDALLGDRTVVSSVQSNSGSASALDSRLPPDRFSVTVDVWGCEVTAVPSSPELEESAVRRAASALEEVDEGCGRSSSCAPCNSRDVACDNIRRVGDFDDRIPDYG